jgi:hypothetical protein
VPNRGDDRLRIWRMLCGPGKDDSQVALFVIDGGGHTWPGRELSARFLGKSALVLPANDLIWKFFEDHPIKPDRDDHAEIRTGTIPDPARVFAPRDILIPSDEQGPVRNAWRVSEDGSESRGLPPGRPSAARSTLAG